MYKQSSSNNNNYAFSNINHFQNINTISNISETINNNKLKNNDKCPSHQELFIKYCTNCNVDICQFCIPLHNNHLLINYEDIFPDEEEKNILKNTLKHINEDYSKLLEEIQKWKKNLEEKIFYFERLIEKNEIINDIDFIYNFDFFPKNFSTIMKFRQIFSSVISPEKSNKNNNIMKITRSDKKYNMGYFNYYQYSISKALLELLINNNQEDINDCNDNNFIYKGNLIIKYLWDSFEKTNNENNNNSRMNKKIKINMNTKKNRNSKSYYSTATYSGPLRVNNDDDNYFNEKNKDRNLSNKQSKIIEKHIDLKMGSRKSLKNNINININNSSYINTMPNNFNNIFMRNNNDINYNFNDNNNFEPNADKYNTFSAYNTRTLPSSYSSQNLIISKTINNNKNNIFYSRQNNQNAIYEKLISYTPLA